MITLRNSIELDFVLDDGLGREFYLSQIQSYGLSYKILTENGPAGGNPLLEISGSKEQIEKYLRESYLAGDYGDLEVDESEVEFYMSFMKEANA